MPACSSLGLSFELVGNGMCAGLVFVGGFSYADVLDSAKGWAGTIRHNARLWESFLAFYQR